MQSERKHNARELCCCKEMIATSENDRLLKMETSWRDLKRFDLTVFENFSKFSRVFPPAFGGKNALSVFFLRPWGSSSVTLYKKVA